MVQTGDKVWGKGGDIDRVWKNWKYKKLAAWAENMQKGKLPSF
jgi:hypothetical protein